MVPTKLLIIVSDNEQDRMHRETWWRESTVEEKELVWDAIQVHYDDPVKELVTRFAQLAFGEVTTPSRKRDGFFEQPSVELDPVIRVMRSTSPVRAVSREAEHRSVVPSVQQIGY